MVLVRAGNRYLVGAGSIHPNGRYYENARDIEPIPMPDWLCDFVAKHSNPSKPAPCDNTVEVADDFDFEDMVDFYGIGIAGEKDDVWQVVEECPGVGYRHSGSTLTAFYWDGSSLGWSCFAQGCPLQGKRIGQVIAFLNAQKGEPYTGPIWERDDDAQLAAKWNVEMLNDEEYPEPPAAPRDEPQAAPKPEPEATDVPEEPDEGEPEEEEPEESDSRKDWKLSGYIGGDKGGLGLLTKSAAAYIMTELTWVWPQRIPEGKMTFYTGKQDCCKSLATLDMVARVTTGMDFPDGAKNPNPPSRVLIASSEDDPCDTIVPRLVAAGADLTMVDIVEGTLVVTKGTSQPTKKKQALLNLKRDAKVLLEVIKASPDIKLLVLDPITSFFGDADQNKDKDVRPIMDELSRVCRKSGMTVVGIIHSSKRSDVSAVHKVGGAGALAASVRAVWGFSRDTEDKALYHMAFVKGNLGREKTGINYIVQEVQVDIGNGKMVGHPHLVWGDKIEEDADDLLSAERANKEVKDTKSIMATALIRSMIPALAADIFIKGEAEGISANTIRNARYKMPDVFVTRTAPNGTVDTRWWWVKVGEPRKEEPVITEDKAF